MKCQASKEKERGRERRVERERREKRSERGREAEAARASEAADKVIEKCVAKTNYKLHCATGKSI